MLWHVCVKIRVIYLAYHSGFCNTVLRPRYDLNLCIAFSGPISPALEIQWTLPLLRRVQRDLFLAAETLNAWSALEVFVVAIIVAILQIQRV